MKLKKAETTETVDMNSATDSAVIADRFRLDVEPVSPGFSGVSKGAALIALLASLAAAAMVGAVAAMMYLNWELIAGA